METIPNPNQCCAAGRMNARMVLMDKISRARRYLASLEALEAAIHWDLLDREKEELLWHYFVSE